MTDNNLVHLLRRAADEKRIAAAAGNDEARVVNQGLANAYEQKARYADLALLAAAGNQ